MLVKTLPVPIIILFLATICIGQQPDPNSPLIKRVNSLQQLLEQVDNPRIEDAKEVLAKGSFDNLFETISEVRRQTAGQKVAEIMLEGPTLGVFVYELENSEVTIKFTLSAKEPIRVLKISFTETPMNGESPPLTWENLETSLDAAADNGFEGAVLVTRNGEIFLNKAYGFANREKNIKNSIDTIFAVGSAPIDFTHAGILLLKDQDKLKLDDPITRFFDDVPQDKRAITINHLLSGGSGLPDFHHVATDKNHDHTWIDRDEAIRRILSQKLLFEPGKRQVHSHSAWGLLAAIIEIVSNESYAEFTTERLFKPVGMHDTGFFGEPLEEERVAVGYGEIDSSNPNSPPHWGKTSWLVMGSGGQTSTLADMFRWIVAMREGKLLSPESTRLYLGPGEGIHANGDMFGFEFIHSTIPDQMFMIISNTVDSREARKEFGVLARQLHQLIQPEKAPAKFSLGITMGITGTGVVVQSVLPGSAAELGGLKVGDELIAANDNSLFENPLDVLSPLLQTNKPIKFKVLRDGASQAITVTPQSK